MGDGQMAQRSPEAEVKRPPIAQILGDNLYRRRVLTKPKMSQQKLADLSEVAVSTIQLLEAQRLGGVVNNPQLDTIEKLAAGLGCDPADLLRWETDSRVKLPGQSPRLSILPGGKAHDAATVVPLRFAQPVAPVPES